MLTINDLSASQKLDGEAMTIVRGGTLYGCFPPIGTRDPLSSLNHYDLDNRYYVDTRVGLDATTQAGTGI